MESSVTAPHHNDLHPGHYVIGKGPNTSFVYIVRRSYKCGFEDCLGLGVRVYHMTSVQGIGQGFAFLQRMELVHIRNGFQGMHRPLLVQWNRQQRCKIKIHRFEEFFVLTNEILFDDIERLGSVIAGQKVNEPSLAVIGPNAVGALGLYKIKIVTVSGFGQDQIHHIVLSKRGE